MGGRPEGGGVKPSVCKCMCVCICEWINVCMDVFECVRVGVGVSG